MRTAWQVGSLPFRWCSISSIDFAENICFPEVRITRVWSVADVDVMFMVVWFGYLARLGYERCCEFCVIG